MPTYRLRDGYGSTTDTFRATTDRDAEDYGRTRAEQLPRNEPRFGGTRDFQVHRREGEAWQFLVAWVPA